MPFRRGTHPTDQATTAIRCNNSAAPGACIGAPGCADDTCGVQAPSSAFLRREVLIYFVNHRQQFLDKTLALFRRKGRQAQHLHEPQPFCGSMHNGGAIEAGAFDKGGEAFLEILADGSGRSRHATRPVPDNGLVTLQTSLPRSGYPVPTAVREDSSRYWWRGRSEEHTSELQSRENLVCRLLLEKKKRKDSDCYHGP